MPRHWYCYRVHVHFGWNSKEVCVFVVAACELVGADGGEVRQYIFRFEVPIADPHFSHGYLGRICMELQHAVLLRNHASAPTS